MSSVAKAINIDFGYWRRHATCYQKSTYKSLIIDRLIAALVILKCVC